MPNDYVLGVYGLPYSTQDGSAVAFVSPAQLAGPQRAATLAEVLSQPRICPQLLEPTNDTIPLLERQEQVRVWIGDALRGGDVTAPSAIRTAYRALAMCRLLP